MHRISCVWLCLHIVVLGISRVISDSVVPRFYHKTDFILDTFKKTALKQPGRVRYEDIPDPQSDVSLPLVTITDFATGEQGKEVVLLVAGEHARELITSEIAFWLGTLLAGQTAELGDWGPLQSVQAKAWAHGLTKEKLSVWAEALLKRVIFKIVPVENIVGRKAVEGGNTCLRKTAGGVDLNRNWEHAWKQVEASSDEYGGQKPFSEAESRVIKLIAETARPQAYVNLHSGEWALYIPWDSKTELAPNLPADTNELLEKMNIFCECMSGPAGKVAGYLAFGSSMDYLYVTGHVPYSLTFEVYGPEGLGKLARGGRPRRRSLQEETYSLAGTWPEGDSLGHRRQLSRFVRGAADVSASAGNAESELERCVRDYNPTSLEEYQEVVSNWVAVMLVLADHLMAHPGASTAQQTAEQEEQPKPPNPPSKMDLEMKGKVADQEKQEPLDFMKALSVLGKRGSGLAATFQLPASMKMWSGSSSNKASGWSVWLLILAFGMGGGACLVLFMYSRGSGGSVGARLSTFRGRRGPQKARNV